MMKVSSLTWVFLTLLLFVLVGQDLSAQTNRGSITGSVIDSNGAGIPGAKVIVTNAATNQTITLTTSDNGSFNAPLLEPVVYKIVVEAQGFKKALVENIKVDTSTVTTANIKLEVGEIETQVTISTNDVVLNTDSGTVGQTISERSITDIPIGDQSILNLMLTLPNVSGDLISEVPSTGTGILTPGQGLSVGGGRPGGTSFLADGVNNTSSASGRTIASFSPATVQEFNVQTSNYSAEYGQTTGGIVNVTTKSGGNKFRGQISYFKKDPSLSAAPFTIAAVNRPVSNNKQEDYAFTIGGPIYLPAFGEGGPKLYNGKDRSFFFFAFEPRRVSDFSKVYNLLPTAEMRSGNFQNVVAIGGGYTTSAIASQFNQTVLNTGTIYQYLSCADASCSQLIRNTIPTTSFAAFPNNTIPTNMLDPTAQKLLQYLPLPNQTPFIQPNGNLANWVGDRNVFSEDNRYQFRIDHQINNANRLTFRYSFVPISGYRFNYSDSTNDDQVNALIGDENTSRQFVLSDTHIFSANLINEFRAGYSRGNFSRVNPPRWQNESFAAQFGLPSITDSGLPFFTGFQGFRGIGNENITLLGAQIDEGFQLSDTLTKTTGNMTLKFGGDFRLSRLKTAPISTAANGQYNFSTNQTESRGVAGGTSLEGNAFASFLLGAFESYGYRTTVLPYYYRWASGALFVQNDWKVKPNLTLNFGMRYALQLPRWEKYNRQGSFLPDVTQSQTLTDTQRRAIGSAIGIPTSVALTDARFGVVPTSTLIPAFAFSGYGGRSRYITPIDKNGWEPRLGFAWVPNFGLVNSIFGEGRIVIRGGYGMSHSSTSGTGGNPSPDFATAASGSIAYGSATTGQGTGQCNTSFAMTFRNPACLTSLTPTQVVGTIPEDGLVFDSLKYQGQAFIINQNTKVPKSETWSVTAAWEFLRGNVAEFSYTGNRGSNLYIPPVNINPTPFATTLLIAQNGVDPSSANITDPLGRRGLNGNVVNNVWRNSLLSPYVGFGNFLSFYDSRGESIRHAGSVYVKGRLNRTLNYTFSYTWSKSIDTGSDAGSGAIANIFTSRADGYSRFGLPTSLDRSVSAFDVPHAFSGTFIYDLPVGRGKALFRNANRWVDQLVGGWTISGTARRLSSYPFAAYVQGNNWLDGSNSSSIRMNINPNLSDWKKS